MVILDIYCLMDNWFISYLERVVKMLIIEGTRQSGKKTLGHKLALELNLPIYNYTQSLKANGHYTVRDINKDLLEWESKAVGIYIGHPLINEYIYGPLLRKRIIPEFLNWEVRPMIKYLLTTAVVVYCRPSVEIDDPALPLYDLLLNTPLLEVRSWRYDYVTDPDAEGLLVPLKGYLQKAVLDNHHTRIGGKFRGRRRLSA